MQNSNYMCIRLFQRCLPVHTDTAPIRWSIVMHYIELMVGFFYGCWLLHVHIRLNNNDNSSRRRWWSCFRIDVFELNEIAARCHCCVLCCTMYWFKCSIPIEKNKRPKPNIQMILFVRARKRDRGRDLMHFWMNVAHGCVCVCVLASIALLFQSTTLFRFVSMVRSFVRICSTHIYSLVHNPFKRREEKNSWAKN